MKPIGPGLPKNPYGGIVHQDENYWAYSTDANGYGGGAFGGFLLNCVGTITTVYEWVPDQIEDPNNPGHQIDDPLDVPPEYVISMEYCSANAMHGAYGTGAFADSSNGLGFDTHYDGDGVTYYEATCEGTLYTKRAGGQTVTLQCNPYASSYGDVGDFGAAGVVYTSQILVPRVSPAGITRFFVPEEEDFLTGQQITASVVGGLTVKTYQWSTDSGGSDLALFKDYRPSLSTNQLLPLSPGDYVQSTLPFYTAGAGNITVKCNVVFNDPANETIKYAGGLPNFLAKSRQVRSVKPSALTASFTQDAVRIYNNHLMIYGYPTGPNGQDWTVTIAVPSPFSQVGSGCFAQLVSANRERWRNVVGNYHTHWMFTSTDALDNAYPYPWGSGQWSLPGNGRFFDAPSEDLDLYVAEGGGNDWYHDTASDSFKTWVMYRPPAVGSQGTAWVPLQLYTWAWNGDTTKTSGNWSVPLLSGQPGKTGGPTHTTRHPTWSAVVTNPPNYWWVP